MTTNSELTGAQLAAALAEEIYRRNTLDQPVTLAALGVEAKTLTNTPDGLTPSGGFYYSERGFVGQVVEKNGTYYVIFRGTDLTESFLNGALDAAGAGWDQQAEDVDDHRST